MARCKVVQSSFTNASIIPFVMIIRGAYFCHFMTAAPILQGQCPSHCAPVVQLSWSAYGAPSNPHDKSPVLADNGISRVRAPHPLIIFDDSAFLINGPNKVLSLVGRFRYLAKRFPLCFVLKNEVHIYSIP
jgi:hypothetical protein